MRLALFDFDGTLTRVDTLQHFIIFSVGRWRYFLGLILLSPALILYVLKIISNDRAKEIMLGHFFKGWDVDYFEEMAEIYSLTELDKIMRKKALERIKFHQANNDRIIVVSASILDWIQPWCRVNNIELIATTLEKKGGIITGIFCSKNCNGREKVVQIQRLVDLKKYDQVFVYGDTSGDDEMLALATNNNGFKKLFN